MGEMKNEDMGGYCLVLIKGEKNLKKKFFFLNHNAAAINPLPTVCQIHSEKLRKILRKQGLLSKTVP